MTDQKWYENNNPDREERMLEAIGFSNVEWKVVHNIKIEGKSQTTHAFDIALESLKDHSIIPVLYLQRMDEGKAEKIMLHRVKSADVMAAVSYVAADFDLETKEKALCDICNLKIIRIQNSDNNINDVNTGPMASDWRKAPVSVSHDQEEFRERRQTAKRRNRDRTRIIEEILENVLYLKNASITQLIYKCNLNYKSAKSILNDLIKRGLVRLVELEESNRKYELTDRGRRALERLRVYEAV